MATEDILVAVYEDGTRYDCAVSMWRSANEENEECMDALERMRQGETVHIGGGAQPFCTLWIETQDAREIQRALLARANPDLTIEQIESALDALAMTERFMHGGLR